MMKCVPWIAILVVLASVVAFSADPKPDGRHGEVLLSWSPVDAVDLAGYSVYMRDVGTDAFAQKTSDTLLTTTTWHGDGLTSPTKEFFVTASDWDGNESAPSTVVVGTPVDRTPPMQVQSLRILELKRTTETVTVRFDVMLEETP